ncbi:hypothetical protein TAGGR_1213 [Thermodesulfovibrio aggregans]|uniref:DUF3108 domain-containing protein n=1 Tax=Thermodesulfovibrio aggregans TaxID=86166 RepID=A0A0U9HM03_9BACT|nr:DUF3108 domain-containing protein [Thermodesulfovibrio aggregans]GAQ94043.1 hypothetical protein TAGGR_1213 [Thermodesulfovibrio aggregans]
MKLRWITVALLISMVAHISIMMALGKIQLNLPSFDFIETYFFQSKKENPKPKIFSKTEQPQHSETEKPAESTQTENSVTEKNTDSQETQSLSQSTVSENTEKVRTLPENNPFTKFINETMKFDIYWMGIYVGSATVSVKGDGNTITITSMVKSASFISNFYYVNDHAESQIENGKPKHFTLVQIEGKYRGNKETIFDYEKGEIVFINHLKNNTTYHKGIDKVFMDVLSGFFYLRTLTINLNEPVAIDIFDSNKFTTVVVQPIKEEKIELSDKQIDAIVIKPQLDTEGLFKRKGDIIIWLSKDNSKIPLKIETKVPVGKVVAELKEYKKD